jgi:hypothetical protein
MGGLYDYFSTNDLSDPNEPEKEGWMLAGFLHDVNYFGEYKVTHTQKTLEVLKKTVWIFPRLSIILSRLMLGD